MSKIKFLTNYSSLVVAGLLLGLFLSLLIRDWTSLRSEGLHDAEWHSTSMADLLQKELSGQQPLSIIFSRLDERDRFEDLDQHINQKIGHLGLLHLKVYNSEGKIVYSNNHEQIGQKIIGSELLEKVKTGVIVSGLVTPQGYQQEYGINSDVVMAEVSIPVYSEENGKVQYVLEVYYDYTPIQDRMNALFVEKALSLLAIFVAVLALLAYLFRKKQSLENKIETLESILPICQHCKKIRIETPGEPDRWQTVESYFSRKDKVKFSHGICNDCLSEYYPELNKRR